MLAEAAGGISRVEYDNLVSNIQLHLVVKDFLHLARETFVTWEQQYDAEPVSATKA